MKGDDEHLDEVIQEYVVYGLQGQVVGCRVHEAIDEKKNRKVPEIIVGAARGLEKDRQTSQKREYTRDGNDVEEVV